MKKIVSIMMVLVLLLLMTACGGKGDETKNDGGALTTAESTEQQSDDLEGDLSSHQQGYATFDEASGWVLENPIIYEDEDCRYEVVKIYPNAKNRYGYVIKTKGINKRAKKIHFSHKIFVNGVEGMDTHGEIIENVKQEGPTEVEFLTDMEFEGIFKLLGITDIQHIELKYDIIINGGSENQIVHEGYYDIFPKGEENRVKHVRDLETDIVLVDNDYVRILLTELDEFRNFNTGNDKILSLNFHYFIENKTDQLLETNFYNIYLNGLEEKITDFHYAYTQPHRATYRSVYLGEDDLEALGIKEFKDVKFKLQVLDKNGDRIMAEEFQFERKDFKKEFKYE